MSETYESLQRRCNKACGDVEKYRNMLEDVVNELDLSETAIEKHGPIGTPPSELVREVLAEKNRIISCLSAGLMSIIKENEVNDE